MPEPTCDGETFILQPLKVTTFNAKLAAITCVKCSKIVTVLDTQASQDVYQNTQKILAAVRQQTGETK